jgi:large subunit ribosomal protein L6
MSHFSKKSAAVPKAVGISRIAKYPVAVPKGVEVSLAADKITVKGPQGTLSQALTGSVLIKHEADALSFVAADDTRHAKAMSGTERALVANMVTGVSKGFERKLSLVGVGYRAQVEGTTIKLQLGFSHDIHHELSAGVKAECPTPTEIIIRGADKQVVGQVAAKIRAYRKPEPYKGKGVRYFDEQVIIKETKKK